MEKKDFLREEQHKKLTRSSPALLAESLLRVGHAV
jgi:hypothetical protein